MSAPSDTPSPSAPAEPTASRPPPVGRRWPRRLAWGFAALALLGALALWAAWWALGNAAATAWVLSRVPMMEITEPDGGLLGDFRAKKLVIHLSGTNRIEIDEPAWTGLRVTRSRAPSAWAHLAADTLSARRVAVITQPSGEPSSGLPTSIHLPVSIEVPQVRADELVVTGMPFPLRHISGGVHLGAEHGKLHRATGVRAQLEALQITGDAQIGAGAPMAMDVALSALRDPSSEAALPAWAQTLREDWRASLNANGPLARFNTQASLRAKGQSLDLNAVVAPVAPWPLPELALTANNVDLSALLASAPATALSGNVTIQPRSTEDTSLVAHGDLSNTQPGRWSERRLPIRSVKVHAGGDLTQLDRLDVTQLDVQLANGARAAGRLQAQGRWHKGQFDLRATLQALQPAALDDRLPLMTLSGPLQFTGHQARQDDPARQSLSFQATADVKGEIERPSPQGVQVRLNAQGSGQRIEIQELRAAVGAATATLSGSGERVASAWQLRGQAALVDFDPLPWFPGLPGSAWQEGRHRLNLHSDWAFTLPDHVVAARPHDAMLDRLAGLRGTAGVSLHDSLLAGVPLRGDVTLSNPSAARAIRTTADLHVAGNSIRLQGDVTTEQRGRDDRWKLSANAPVLERLEPLLRLVPAIVASGLAEGFRGAMQAEAELSGRWPQIRTQGQATLGRLNAGPLAVQVGDLSWSVGSQPEDPLNVQAKLDQVAWGRQQAQRTTLDLHGTPRQHTVALRTTLKAAPPQWVTTLQGPNAAAALGNQRTAATLQGSGSLDGAWLTNTRTATPLSWSGTLQRLELRDSDAATAPWLQTTNVPIAYRGGPSTRVELGAGRAEIVTAALRWSRLEWEAGEGVRTQQLDVLAELEPLTVAPLLQRIQPAFGWGGDLQIGGKVLVHQGTEFKADIVLERLRGDLHVTDEAGTQALGLSDLRLGLTANEGVWSFTQGLAGKQLGVAAGAVVVRTSPQRAWPEAEAPMSGVLEAQVANLGTWGAWVPPGWRLGGRLGVTASIGGAFGAPEYTGAVKGQDIAVRNVLMGVNVTEGHLDVALQGDTARIVTFTARGGPGQVSLTGGGHFGAQPRAQLRLAADRFRVLARVDRRVVLSGDATLDLDRDNVRLDGRFDVNGGLFDFSQGDAPSLGDDVVVTGRSTTEPVLDPTPPRRRDVVINLAIGLGERLRLRGYGIDTRLTGELTVTNPGGKLALNGSVATDEGTFKAYGQSLIIDRGIISFVGVPENPRLDIEAIRPDIDVRVGVAVTGTAQTPRIRLVSNMEMSDNEKLSWLVLGRAPDELGTSDTALLQRAAFALLAGDGESGQDQITKALGLDQLSLRQTDGDTRDTVVSVGKQLSRRWYVGYERSLNATTGTWQLIYRIAQRFTLRAQSGLDNSVDLIWTWRWE